MAQHDMDLANAAGAAFRSDANDAIEALVTLSSGATAPSTTYAHQLWADTATGLLKIRNAANSAWIVLGPTAAPMPRRGYLSGMTLSNNVSDATNDIDFAAGECADSTNATVMRSASTITKRLDAAWAAGTGNGGLDTGSIADTTYHCYAIQKDSDGTTDFLFSASVSSPTMPTGYTYFRRIGSILRESSAIVGFVQDGDLFMRKVPKADVDGSSEGTSANLKTLSVPSGVKVLARVAAWVFVNASENTNVALLATDPDQTNTAPSTNVFSLVALALGGTVAYDAAGMLDLRTDTSARIRTRLSYATNTTLRITTHGWIDSRGRV